MVDNVQANPLTYNSQLIVYQCNQLFIPLSW